MKSTFLKYLALVLAVGICALACKKNNFIVDKDPLIPGDGAHFVVKPAIPTAVTYFPFSISATPAPGSVYKLPVGLTNVAAADRTVSFSYTSRTAVNGTQYSAPTTLTIKAGTALDTLRIQGLFSGYTVAGRKDTLKIKITASTGGSVSNVGYQDSIFLVLQKFCPLNMADFQGNFVVVRDDWQDYFPGDIVPLTVTGNVINFDYPTPFVHKSIPIAVDPNSFVTSSVSTAFGAYSNGGTSYTSVSVASASNYVAPCDGIVSILLNFTKTGSTTNYGNGLLVLKKL